MHIQNKTERRLGKYITCSIASESYKAFIPPDLPPEPSIVMEGMNGLLEQANIAIGRLDGLTAILPDASLFIYMYIRKEALLSSQIEGTQSTFTDLLLFENHETPSVSINDVQEVSNYIAAMNYGLKRIQEDDFPLCLRLLREIHKILLSNGRGSLKNPGEFRTSQNWIGGSRPGNALFVPPPPNELIACLSNFERFLHDENNTYPTLIQAAIAHLHFETIHPFLDGNGRLGRLLITFLLCMKGLLKKPILYLSLYFKTNRETYYNLLQSVRETGNWEIWIEFFLQGTISTANQATEAAINIYNLFEKNKRKIESLGKPTASALKIHHYLEKNPITPLSAIVKELKLSLPTVSKTLNHLTDLGIVKEITGKQRHKIYKYQDYLDILSEGVEPL